MGGSISSKLILLITLCAVVVVGTALVIDYRLTEKEILFEAANTLRMGKDLLYLASSSGNIKGAKWLKQVLPEMFYVRRLVL